MQVEWSPLSLEIRVRLVNTSLCYRRRGGDTDPTTDSLYVCKFVDTWAHSYWAVKYDSPINNDNLGRPIMPKLRGHGRAKVEQWLAHALVAPPTKFNVGSRHRADKTFFPTGKFISARRSTPRNFDGKPDFASARRLQRIGCETCCKNRQKWTGHARIFRNGDLLLILSILFRWCSSWADYFSFFFF